MSIRRNKLFLLSMVALFFLLILLWENRFSVAKYWYMKEFFKLSPKQELVNSDKEIMEDRKLLNAYQLFAPSTGSRDAGHYLNNRLHWEIGESHHQGDLVFPEFMNKEMSTDDWVTKKPLFKKMGLNFFWLKTLQNYDVWSLEKGGPAYNGDRKYQPFQLPYPTYLDLLTWAKFRWLYGKETGDVYSALSEVRHLMRLIWTNDNLLSAMIVIKMLKAENQFKEILNAADIKDWQFIPMDHVHRAKRYFYTLPAGTDIRLTDELFEKMIKTNAGSCLMLYEGMMFYLGARDLLSDELHYGYNRMQQAISKSSCRRTVLHDIWKDKNWVTLEGLPSVKILGKTLDEVRPSQVKDFKAAMGYILGTVNGPTYAVQYGDKKQN